MKGKIAWIKVGEYIEGELSDLDDTTETFVKFVEPESWEKGAYEKIIYFPVEDEQ